MSPSKPPAVELACRVAGIAVAMFGALGTVNCGGVDPSGDGSEPEERVVGTVQDTLPFDHTIKCPGSPPPSPPPPQCIMDTCGRCFINNTAISNFPTCQSTCGGVAGCWGTIEVTGNGNKICTITNPNEAPYWKYCTSSGVHCHETACASCSCPSCC